MRITDEDPPKVYFDEAERAEFAELARRRQAAAVDYLVKHGLATPKKALEENSLGNHFAGEFTERAVAFWLGQRGVDASRADSIVAEISGGQPDIRTKPHNVRLDVKGSIYSGQCRMLARQVKEDPQIAVLWCIPLREEGYKYSTDYDTTPPIGGDLLGWATMAEAKDADLEDGWKEIPRYKLRTLPSLLTWIETGVLPPA